MEHGGWVVRIETDCGIALRGLEQGDEFPIIKVTCN